MAIPTIILGILTIFSTGEEKAANLHIKQE